MIPVPPPLAAERKVERRRCYPRAGAVTPALGHTEGTFSTPWSLFGTPHEKLILTIDERRF